MYITRLASNEIFSPSNKIHEEVGRAKDLSAPQYVFNVEVTEVEVPKHEWRNVTKAFGK